MSVARHKAWRGTEPELDIAWLYYVAQCEPDLRLAKTPEEMTEKARTLWRGLARDAIRRGYWTPEKQP